MYILVHSALLLQIASATITSLTPDQLVQLPANHQTVAKGHKPDNPVANPLSLSPENDYDDDTVRLDKRSLKGHKTNKLEANPISQSPENDYNDDTVRLDKTSLKGHKTNKLEANPLSQSPENDYDDDTVRLDKRSLKGHKTNKLEANPLSQSPENYNNDTALLLRPDQNDYDDTVKLDKRSLKGNKTDSPVANPLSQSPENYDNDTALLLRPDQNDYDDDTVRLDKRSLKGHKTNKLEANPLSQSPENYNNDTALLLRPDQNDYDDDTVRLNKRSLKDIDSISAADIVRSAMSHQVPSKKSVRSAKLKEKKTRDLVLEVVKKLIAKEKTRKRFELVNYPPNSKYTKQDQLLWDRLRVKAAGEILLRQKPRPQKPTERIFDTLKSDLEEMRKEPTTTDAGLFAPLKSMVEKKYYQDKYQRGRLFISTLKPDYY